MKVDVLRLKRGDIIVTDSLDVLHRLEATKVPGIDFCVPIVYRASAELSILHEGQLRQLIDDATEAIRNLKEESAK